MPQQPCKKCFLTYELDGILYGDQRLILNRQEGILTLSGDGEDVSAQACLPAHTLAVMQALLDAHPAPCPQAVLYSLWAGVELEAAREMLAVLLQAGYLDLVLRGLYRVLAECRAKLALFNLGVQPAPEEEGYRLFRLSLV